MSMFKFVRVSSSVELGVNFICLSAIALIETFSPVFSVQYTHDVFLPEIFILDSKRSNNQVKIVSIATWDQVQGIDYKYNYLLQPG